jgi:polysaccharide pyruvyl transferase WcaK-like protein
MTLPTRIARWSEPSEVFDILSSVDFIVSQRLHGLIIGTMLGIPLLGISDDHKLEFFLKETGQKFLRLSGMDINVVTGIINDIWQWRGDFKKLIDDNLPKLKYRSYLNIKGVAELLQ